jgi:hypothetical protein
MDLLMPFLYGGQIQITTSATSPCQAALAAFRIGYTRHSTTMKSPAFTRRSAERTGTGDSSSGWAPMTQRCRKRHARTQVREGCILSVITKHLSWAYWGVLFTCTGSTPA